MVPLSATSSEQEVLLLQRGQPCLVQRAAPGGKPLSSVSTIP